MIEHHPSAAPGRAPRRHAAGAPFAAALAAAALFAAAAACPVPARADTETEALPAAEAEAPAAQADPARADPVRADPTQADPAPPGPGTAARPASDAAAAEAARASAEAAGASAKAAEASAAAVEASGAAADASATAAGASAKAAEASAAAAEAAAAGTPGPAAPDGAARAAGADAAAGASAAAPAAQSAAPLRDVAEPRRLRFCAGSRTGNYTFAAERIAERARSDALDMEVVTTAGALDNLRRLRAGQCDLGLTQSDVFDLRGAEDPDGVRGIVPFKRVYSEYVHLLCPVASGLTNAAQLGPDTRLITGPEGGGTSETWRAFRAAVPRLEAVQRIPEPINLAAVNRVKDSRDTCMLWVSGLNSNDIRGANAMSANTPDRRRAMRLVSVNERVLRNLRGSDGRPMYRFEPIRARFGSYDNLIDPARDPETRTLRPGTVVVPVVDAIMLVRAEVLDGLDDQGSGLVRMVEEAAPVIWARVSPPVVQRAETPLAARR